MFTVMYYGVHYVLVLKWHKNIKLNHTLPIIPIFRESKKCGFQTTILVGIFFNIFIVVKDKLEDADISLNFCHCP